MKNNESMKMPYHYTAVANQEMEYIDGGAVTSRGLLNFISYLLGGLNISFGSKNSHVNTDTVTVDSQATTGATTGRGGIFTSVWSSAGHSNEDTISRGEYFNWGANFNLGGLFNALLRLFF